MSADQTTDLVPPMAWSLLPDERVRALAQGCRELSCPRHGRFNQELRRRANQKEADRG